MPTVYATFDQETLDREYSPSSRVSDIQIYLDDYRRLSDAALLAAKASGLCERNVSYGGGADETLDLFLPPRAERAPLQVYVHGGYWQLLSKNESSFAAPMFQRHAAAFAAINYTLAPAQTLTGIVAETRRAIAFLYRNAERWNIDRRRVFVSGSSAGAHLVAMLIASDWRDHGLPPDCIKGACAVSGLYDLEPVRLSYVNDVVGMDEAEARQNSPLHLPLGGGPPILLAYGDNETGEFKRQTDRYRQKLEDEKRTVAFAEIAERNHFDVILDLGDETTWLGDQVLRQMGLR